MEITDGRTRQHLDGPGPCAGVTAQSRRSCGEKALGSPPVGIPGDGGSPSAARNGEPTTANLLPASSMESTFPPSVQARVVVRSHSVSPLTLKRGVPEAVWIPRCLNNSGGSSLVLQTKIAGRARWGRAAHHDPVIRRRSPREAASLSCPRQDRPEADQAGRDPVVQGRQGLRFPSNAAARGRRASGGSLSMAGEWRANQTEHRQAPKPSLGWFFGPGAGMTARGKGKRGSWTARSIPNRPG